MTEATFRFRAQARKALEERREYLSDLPFVFADHLEQARPAWMTHERLLPAPKSDIVRALLFSLANSKTTTEFDLFSAALLTLSRYQDLGDEDIITMPDAKNVSLGNPQDFVDLHQNVGTFLKASSQYNDHLQNDLEFFREWIDKAKAANQFLWPRYKIWFEKLRPSNQYRSIPPQVIDFPTDENGKL